MFTITSFQDYAATVKPALDDAFKSRLLQSLGSVPPGCPDCLPGLSGGKKIRGVLLCLVAATLGGSLEAALPRAVAVEMIQTATLVHDDFVDQHRRRRQHPALWTLVGARRAVLLGDVIFSSAIFLMSELSPKDCGVAAKTIAQLARGAWQEPLDGDGDALLEAFQAIGYERIIALKTGMLFAAACELGAVAAGVSDGMQQRWRRYGQKIGEAYQLTDDLHEIDRTLRAGSLGVVDLSELAPALLHFVPRSRFAIDRMRSGQQSDAAAELLSCLEAAAGFIRSDRTRRLELAVAEMDDLDLDGPLFQLARRTPRELIGLFDGEPVIC